MMARRRPRCSRCDEPGHNRATCPELNNPTKRLIAQLKGVKVGKDGFKRWDQNPEVTYKLIEMLSEAMEHSHCGPVWQLRAFRGDNLLEFKRLILKMLWHPRGEWVALWAIGAITVVDVKRAVYPDETLAKVEKRMRDYTKALTIREYSLPGKTKSEKEERLHRFLDRVTARGWSPLLEPARWREWVELNKIERPFPEG